MQEICLFSFICLMFPMPWFISLNYCIGPLFLHSCIHPVLWAYPGQPRRWASPDGWSTPITAALSCFGLLMSLLPWYIFSIFLLLILLLSALTSILTKSLLLSFCHDFHSYNLFYLKCFVSSFHCIQSQRQCCTKNLLMIASVTSRLPHSAFVCMEETELSVYTHKGIMER